MAKHLQSSKFTAKGIFTGLKSFEELEARISALPLEKERGDAFEVFAEAYLATQPICQVKTVWPQSSAPSTLLKSLGLPVSRDMGTDGLVELRDGRIASYQAKFYTGRPSLNWGLLSTFFAISDRVAHTIIFTNSDSLASTIERRQNFIAIRGTDLDRLTHTDFSIIEKWLKGSPVTRVIPKPRPHQEKALKDLLPALASSNRATVIMACGTGKTLLSLWAAERLGVKNVLVLVPSLALIQQTLHGWLAATGWNNLAYLCVCSDPTITDGADELIVKRSDLDFEVTTAPIDVKRFLENDYAGVKVVFSTYMSAGVVGEALKGRDIFDLGIFDEAHKTAGREGKNSAFALSDKNLPLKKRLFMTATPRHYNVLKRDKEGDAKLVYSMDVPESYGAVVHKLPFAEAARAGIISRYKVVISVVTSEMVQKELLSRGKVLVERDEVHAQQVANQIALAIAVEKHGVGKIITFHKNIKSAQSFTLDGPEGIATHLKDFSVFHINGTMPSAEREKLMNEFKNTKRGLVSNARCLTEGVDVPAVDMVAFLNPKRSTVDIVQATGRAMRKAPNKEFGYVLVPLYLEVKKGETVEDAVQRGNFEEVWDILSALQEQDEVLADIIQEMRQDKGRINGYNDARFREEIEILGPTISLQDLRRSITTSCIERLVDNWHERLGELVAYKTKHGDCNIPSKWPENQALASWIGTQRQAYVKGKLSPDKIARLTEIGFDWDPLASGWEKSFDDLRVYKAKNGDCNVPQKFPENPDLSQWVAVQRMAKRAGKMTKDRENRLIALGFDWNRRLSAWEEAFGKLQQYRAEYGDCNVPDGWAENPHLGRWVGRQRILKGKGRLSPDREHRLAALGINWDIIASAWEEKFRDLTEHKAKYGNCNVPVKWPENQGLGNWVAMQRVLRTNGELPREREQRLNSLGFDWAPIMSVWEENFRALEQYKKVHGDCNVPAKWPENRALGTWIRVQRRTKFSGKISEERVKRLTALGFDWDYFNSVWEENFRILEQYKAKYGNCSVPGPKKWTENPAFASWVGTQRSARVKGKLTKEREARLTALGFDWNTIISAWEYNFHTLEEYKKKYGDCNVPWDWTENPSLGVWIVTQRRARVTGKLSKENVDRLSELGFVWEPLTSVWEKNFHDLEQYKKTHGDCNVPHRWPENLVLAGWVREQRYTKGEGKISKERENRLTALGFNWDPLILAWEDKFRALESYKVKHGNCNVPKGWAENIDLGTWVTVQRITKCKGKMTKEREGRLTALGFDWDPFATAWENYFKVLQEYKAKNGDCNVPQKYPQNLSLGRWVSRQRRVKAKLSKVQIERLTNLGFEWSRK